MANIKSLRTDFCIMDWSPDTDYLRKNYGDEAADNYIIWNFKQRLGRNVDVVSISVAQILSFDEEIPNWPKKVMYMCVYQ